MYSLLVQELAFDDKVKLEYSDESGFYISALKDINPKDIVFKIPYESILTPADPFPYKETIAKTLKKMEAFLADKPDVKFSMLPIMLYIERNMDEKLFQRRFARSGLTMYRSKSPVNRAYINSLPLRVGTIKNWDQETYEFYKSIAYGVAPYVNNFEAFYSLFMETLATTADSDDVEDLMNLFSNKEDLNT